MFLLAACALPLLMQSPAGVDTDHDGLSDYDEIHKYLTDPNKADTDGDGLPDGDWDERREFNYSVRAVLKVLPPINVASLNDDYQDGRVLRSNKDFVEIEVVCYPFNTVDRSIGEDMDWRAHAEELEPWTQPGPTSNWDSALRHDLLAELSAKGIDAWKFSDHALVEQASHWLLERTKTEDTFITFFAEFVDGRPQIAPGTQDAVEAALASSGRSLEDQWQRSLFGKSMFSQRVHGTCTSTAIYLTTCLRALGMPTRMILCVPVVDASDPVELKMAREHLSHNLVRRTITRAAAHAGNSWSSHTFNEVFVDGRWRRLNYERLGQNILDANCLGLMVHVNTFRDFAESGLFTWGQRFARDHHADVFGGSNPYSCIELSDLFGSHANVANPTLPEHKVLTISHLYWFDDPGKPKAVTADKPLDPAAGHILAHVDEVGESEGSEPYREFYEQAGKRFTLRSPGHPDVSASAHGYWLDAGSGVREFYVQVLPKDFARMDRHVAYALVPEETPGDHVWKVADGVTITRP